MNKIILLITALMLSGGTAFAQRSYAFVQEVTIVQSDAVTPLKKAKRVRLPPIEYRHEFRAGVGYGTAPLAPMHQNEMKLSERKIGAQGATYSVYYGCRIIKGLKVTLTASYVQFSTRRYDATSVTIDDYIGIDHFHHFRVTPAVHYEWYNRGIVTMYSDIGCTFDFAYRDSNIKGQKSWAWDYPNGGGSMAIRPNVTPFGITVGKKLFGFAEVFSLGPRGLFNAGIGYRFQ